MLVVSAVSPPNPQNASLTFHITSDDNKATAYKAKAKARHCKAKAKNIGLKAKV